MSYNVGDLVTISGTLTGSDGDELDPTAVFVEYKDPEGNIITLAYPDDAALVRDGAGVYHADISIDQSGYWRYRFYSTGIGQGASEQSFSVKASAFG